MKIVQFKDGRYGVRKLTFFGYYFLVYINGGYTWWSLEGAYDYCRWDTVEEAQNALNKYTDNGTPV